jgi:hypothetical protein
LRFTAARITTPLKASFVLIAMHWQIMRTSASIAVPLAGKTHLC